RDRILRVVEDDPVVAVGHRDRVADERFVEVLLGESVLPLRVVLGPEEDLPEKAVVPHELAGVDQRAVFDGDVRRESLDLRLAPRLESASDRDRGAAQMIRSDLAEHEPGRDAAGRSRDDDATRADVRLPRVRLFPQVEAVAEERAAGPAEVDEIL